MQHEGSWMIQGEHYHRKNLFIFGALNLFIVAISGKITAYQLAKLGT
jgi:hypothetical protein